MAASTQSDLKKKQRVNNALLFSEPFIHAYLERIGEAGIVIVDTEGTLLYASLRACQVLGEKQEAMLHKNYFTDFVFYNDQDSAIALEQCPAWHAVHTRRYTQITPFFCWYKNEAGEKTPLVQKVTQVEEGGKMYAIIEIREAKRNLKVDEMKTLFISFAAHQLKTPSSIVKGFVELLLREGKRAFTKTQWEHLESAYEANEQLIRLSKNLLNVTKLEGGMIEPAISFFDAREIVEGKISTHQLLFSIKNLSVEIEGPKEIYFESDPMFFSEIYEIMLSNAMKYSPENGKILVRLTPSDAHLKVEVEDQGPGVSEEQQTQLFQAFSASQTHTNSHGLGLMMAKKYLDLLGGRIGYSRAEGGGSIFFFEIPRIIR
jgi:signal transduction histidine kinase